MMNLTWIIVIFEVEQYLFLNDDLLVGVAHVYHAEGVVGVGDLLQGNIGGLVGLYDIPLENSRGHAVAQVVLYHWEMFTLDTSGDRMTLRMARERSSWRLPAPMI